MARVQLTRQAQRHFEALPHDLQEPVLNALTDLEGDPEAAGKPLLGRLRGLWSARVGRYRIIYSIEGSRRSQLVIVRAIKHRSEAYQQRGRR
ncbi:MAG: type II toxin-antitoxin system RelE family toxin [Actinomycetota bacterium]